MNSDTTILVQVRTNSTRFPKKQFAYIGENQLIDWIILRLSNLEKYYNVVYCIPKGIEDNILNDFLLLNGKKTYRGSENDVLTRLYNSSKSIIRSEYFVRVCADNPFLDSKSIVKLIKHTKENNLDYSFNHLSKLDSNHSDGFGAECFTKNTFDIINDKATGLQREHVTKFIWDNLDDFKIGYPDPVIGLDNPSVSLDFDTYSDFIKLNYLVRDNYITPTTDSTEIVKSWVLNSSRYYTIASISTGFNRQKIKNNLETNLNNLFPLKRSILGSDTLKTLNYIKEIIGGDIRSLKSGEKVFDWEIPLEWTINEAYIENEFGEIIVSNSDNHLHVLNYSENIDIIVNPSDYKNHLFYNKELPEAIPYRTSYYSDNWGFCLTKKQFDTVLTNSKVRFKIDSVMKEGALNYLECFIPGENKDEILISSYVCHPNMANDSLSGVVLAVELYKLLNKRKNKFSYRFVFVPETIGAISFIKNYKKINNCFAGIICTTTAGPGGPQIKLSFDKNSLINSICENLVYHEKINFFDFDIHGSDERQYSSPGVRIPCASIHFSKYYEYKEYHTSFDDLSFIKIEKIIDALSLNLQLIANFEVSLMFTNRFEKGEVFLSNKGLYSTQGGSLLPNSTNFTDSILWILWYKDTLINLSYLSRETKISSSKLTEAYNHLKKTNLIQEVK